MTTTHKVCFSLAQDMNLLEDQSVNLVVTSPPYPMIEMWDEIMSNQNSQIKNALNLNEGMNAFELMHNELDKVWREVSRVISPGGFVCINIGDATRTLNGNFALYPNHSRIISAFLNLRFSNLPNIIWRKQTNAPNKFMGSGMMPAGAYVTLEHEWILVFRKGGKRVFKEENEKNLRRESSFFWEERNVWFSDLWNLKGTRQKLSEGLNRERSAAFPFEIPYRLINMYSLKGDMVLDPFVGTGTTSLAALCSERNSIGFDVDQSLKEIIQQNVCEEIIPSFNNYIKNRLENHNEFITTRESSKGEVKHYNNVMNMPVMTSQEKELSISFIKSIKELDECFFEADYSVSPIQNTSFKLRKKKADLQVSIDF